MKYDAVQTSLEAYVAANWSETSVAFDNVEFDPEALDEYLRCNVLFGDGRARAVNRGCYRQLGLLVLTVFVRPATGQVRRLNLASTASILLTSAVVKAEPPHEAPVINLLVPDVHSNNKEQSGWVQTQLSCPFYYDLEF